jgi:hypothetical protein
MLRHVWQSQANSCRQNDNTQSRFHGSSAFLRVDGQIKRSFSSKEQAATAGAMIEKAFPLVVVTVVDTEKHTTEIINA